MGGVVAVKRSVLACLAGVLSWVVVASLINHLLRATLTGYSAAEHTEQYTLVMEWARLLVTLSPRSPPVLLRAALRPADDGRHGPWAASRWRSLCRCTSLSGATFRRGIT